jgi:hypothetical protein
MLAPFSGQVFDDGAYGLPSIELSNWYVEEAPDRPNRGGRLIPSPGLVLAASPGGSVSGIGYDDFKGHLLVHAGGALVRYNQAFTALRSDVLAATDEQTRFASSQIETVVSTGSAAAIASETGLQTVTLPNGVIGDVAESEQRHVYLEKGTGRVWYSEVADAGNIKADAFLTAEEEPDEVRAVRSFQGSVFLYGARSIQPIRNSGNEAAPFYPAPGGSIAKGCLGRAAVTQADLGQFFVGDDHIVYRLNGYQPQRISTHWLERRIQDLSFADKARVSLTAFAWEGHTLILLRLPGIGSYAYDAATQRWHKRETYPGGELRQRAFREAWGEVVSGTEDGRLWRLRRDAGTDGTDPIVRVASTLVPVEDSRPFIANIVVEVQPGIGTNLPPGNDPVIEVQISRDGRTWGNWTTGSIGRQGQFTRRHVFGPFGVMQPPFFGLKIRTSSPVPVTVTGVKINEKTP